MSDRDRLVHYGLKIELGRDFGTLKSAIARAAAAIAQGESPPSASVVVRSVKQSAPAKSSDADGQQARSNDG